MKIQLTGKAVDAVEVTAGLTGAGVVEMWISFMGDFVPELVQMAEGDAEQLACELLGAANLLQKSAASEGACMGVGNKPKQNNWRQWGDLEMILKWARTDTTSHQMGMTAGWARGLRSAGALEGWEVMYVDNIADARRRGVSA